MELARFRRRVRAVFFLGAMVALFGLGLYIMGLRAGGIILLIAGVAVLTISFSITRMFMQYDLDHRVRTPRKRERNLFGFSQNLNEGFAKGVCSAPEGLPELRTCSCPSPRAGAS